MPAAVNLLNSKFFLVARSVAMADEVRVRRTAMRLGSTSEDSIR
jgi:hypothetical protein